MYFEINLVILLTLDQICRSTSLNRSIRIEYFNLYFNTELSLWPMKIRSGSDLILKPVSTKTPESEILPRTSTSICSTSISSPLWFPSSRRGPIVVQWGQIFFILCKKVLKNYEKYGT